MIKQIFSLILLILGLTTLTIAQQDSDVLFTVDDTPVTVGEFKYIYSKSKGNDADFSKASVEEYLDLYTKFKLKVEKAREMKLDTIPALKRELDGYRRQLASNYLLDKEVLNDLVVEAYDRLQYDVSISHIFFQVSADADAATEKTILQKAKDVRDELTRGKIKFDAAADKYSEDRPTAENGGLLGYITAFYLKQFYEIENAAYNTEVGSVSEPVRTKYGYHLVKVNDKRPARGQVEAAHILLRVENPSEESDVQAKIRQVHKELKDGMDFAAAAKKYSQDESSAFKGGLLGNVSINQYEKSFEETIFRLENDGDYSMPFRSSIGWHIVQRVKKSQKEPLDKMERSLKARVQRDSRFKIVQDKFVETLKGENSFVENEANIKGLTESIDKSFLTPQWKAPSGVEGKLFSINKQTVNVAEFVQFLSRNSANRGRQGRSSTPAQVFDNMYGEFVSKKLIEYEENQLATKYPEFKALMREYEEGILLFEATNLLVWGKAAKDTVGLMNYYDKNKGEYLWEQRVDATTYSMSNEHPTKLTLARKLARKKGSEKVLAKVNTADAAILSASTKTYEKGQNKVVDGLTWKKGSMSENAIEGETVSFVKIESVVKPQPKSFQDARGYVIADYQNYLEQEWVSDLKKAYKVKINQDVLNQLVKN